ncbi:uncharacterized protein LOC128245833 [Mya arenaria]|uniref:uncharacterized protein LOC128245833 n=1 Tax=Mya arenaria TaxID=6604 RepID=UPI0022E65AE0|nr:uncharacterized protein LOC128245833 [Mya arenaria]
MSDSDLCIECDKVVKPLQHAITCDVCDRWQHRVCDTVPVRDVLSVTSDATYIVGPSLNDSREQLFDVTRDGPVDTTVIHERSIGEPMLSCNVVDEAEVEYEVVEEGSNRKRQKLVSSDGFSYCVKVRQKALRDVHAPAGSIVEGNMVGVFKDGEFNIPRPSNLLRRVNRSRQKVRPKDPTSLDFEVDTDYLQESFFIGDVRVGDERHLMFSTPSQLQFLGQARRWYLDGTFRVVNRPFTQLWSVHAFLQQGESVKQVPLLYVLMSKRRKQDYVAVLQKLIEIMEEAPKVEGFVMDFEAGLWQALRSVFPGTQLKGCAFHWCQAVLRHVQHLGLKATLKRREGAHQLIRKLLALPFLPGQHIERAFIKLKDRAEGSSNQMKELFTYVEDQWMESSLWSTTE